MNILCISQCDNGGQMETLSSCLNKYTTHHSNHLNIYQSFLEYDVDIRYDECTEEYLTSLINNTDFFIFSELIPPKLIKIGILDKINKHNLLIRCYGTTCRVNINLLRKWWNKHLGTFTSGGLDPTIHPYLGFVAYHIPNLYEFNKFPKQDKTEHLRICHSSTNKLVKSTDKITNTLYQLKNKYDIEPIIITNKSWADSLKIKAQCHITIDQFKIGVYASSAIESMYLKHVVVSKISPLVRSFHPDLPIIQATEDNLYYVLEDLIKNKDKLIDIGNLGHDYVMREHSAKQNIIKWEYLIKWVSEGFK